MALLRHCLCSIQWWPLPRQHSSNLQYIHWTVLRFVFLHIFDRCLRWEGTASEFIVCLISYSEEVLSLLAGAIWMGVLSWSETCFLHFHLRRSNFEKWKVNLIFWWFCNNFITALTSTHKPSVTKIKRSYCVMQNTSRYIKLLFHLGRYFKNKSNNLRMIGQKLDNFFMSLKFPPVLFLSLRHRCCYRTRPAK